MITSPIIGARTLHVSVKNWLYEVQLVPWEEGATGRCIHIVCQTLNSHFLPPMDLEIEIGEKVQDPIYDVVRHEECKGEQGIKLGEAIRRSDPTRQISDFVLCGMFVGQPRFNCILDILRSSKEEKGLGVSISLSLFGLNLSNINTELDTWPSNRKVAIVNMEFILHPNMNKVT